jgi:cell division control protein 6
MEGNGIQSEIDGVRPDNSIENSIFQSYVKKENIFNNRDILLPSHIPERILYREEQITQLASILAISLKGEKPSNVLIFGKTGTGKTATVKYLGNEMKKLKEEGRADYIYINCEFLDTPYSIAQYIGNLFGQEFDEKIPFTGLSMQRLYSMLKERLDSEKRVVIIVLDEIDKLVKKSGDDILYHLYELNEELSKSRISMLGISNDLNFIQYLDSRVRSRLGSEQLVFPPYNAEQLKEILWQRSKKAFRKGVIDESVISLCAALAAQEHGDARRALDLLRVSGELATRKGESLVTSEHVYRAKNEIEFDCMIEAIRSLPTHSKLVLMGMILNKEAGNRKMTSGEAYNTYVEICKKVGVSALTQRRIADLISELDMLGLISAEIKSFGRGGRTKEISVIVNIPEAKKALEGDDVLAVLKGYKAKFQAKLI